MQQAEAALQQGRANENLARLTAGRMANLLGRGRDLASRTTTTRRRSTPRSRPTCEALEKAVAAMRSSNVAAAEANLARLNEIKTYQTVRAPFDGVITLRNVDTGALVNEGNTLLFRIAQTGPPAHLSQRAADRRRVGASRASAPSSRSPNSPAASSTGLSPAPPMRSTPRRARC